MEACLEEWEVAVPSEATTLSRQHPDVGFDIRPVGFRWVVRCTGPRTSLDALIASERSRLSFLRVERSSEPLVTFVYAPRPPEIAFLRRVGSAGGIVLPPLTVREGRTRVRLLIARERTGDRGAALSPPARLVGRRRLTGPRLREEIERLVPGGVGLTSQQTRVLLEAIRAGYYEVPRRATVEKVARRLSLGRSTAEEHLRAAESAVVSRAAPRIELAASDHLSTDASREHVTGFSSELELYVDLVLRGDRVTNVRLLRSAPRAAAVRSDHPLLRRVLRHLHTGREDLTDVPVDLPLSPFERAVLEEVRRIPLGETRSYSEIARRIGRPGASRAVGNAVAHNPAPLVIPCHRVVPRRGGVGNYSATGGTRTKRRLMSQERAIPAPEGEARPAESQHRVGSAPDGPRNALGRAVDPSPRSPAARRRVRA